MSATPIMHRYALSNGKSDADGKDAHYNQINVENLRDMDGCLLLY